MNGRGEQVVERLKLLRRLQLRDFAALAQKDQEPDWRTKEAGESDASNSRRKPYEAGPGGAMDQANAPGGITSTEQ